jgi:hypothetical protein
VYFYNKIKEQLFMAKFYFKCPFCDKEIKAYPEMIGQVGNCPYCDAEVTIEKPQRNGENTPQQKNDLHDTIGTFLMLLTFVGAVAILFARSTPSRVICLIPMGIMTLYTLVYSLFDPKNDQYEVKASVPTAGCGILTIAGVLWLLSMGCERIFK